MTSFSPFNDRSLEEMGPDPDDELRAEEAELDAFWDALIEFFEEWER